MEDKQITLQIDGHFITVPEGSTILEAATKIGINIPTLCHIDLKGTCIKNNPASCRICVVEVIGRRNLAPACATRCTEGMVVKTSTLRVMNARKVVAELILSDHPNDCLTCPKCGNCELQTLALRFNIREMPFNGGELSPRKREITASIVRNMDKCIFCRRCESVCNDVQTVGALSAIRRGFNTTIAPAFDRMMTESECTYCGQCVAVCPVGALTERDYTNRLLDDLANPDKVVIVQTAPAVRAALGEEFGFPPGTGVTGKMVYALRELGFDYLFDTDFCRPHHYGRRLRNSEPTDVLSQRRQIRPATHSDFLLSGMGKLLRTSLSRFVGHPIYGPFPAADVRFYRQIILGRENGNPQRKAGSGFYHALPGKEI